jgi:hypothetical protein
VREAEASRSATSAFAARSRLLAGMNVGVWAVTEPIQQLMREHVTISG